MSTLFAQDMFIINLNKKDLKDFCFSKQLIKNHSICLECNVSMKLAVYKRNRDGYAWRYMLKTCKNYKKYISIRNNSFFEEYKIDIKLILQIIIRYGFKTSRNSIVLYFGNINKSTISKIIGDLIRKMPYPNFNDNKLGGPNHIVQVDETMLNYKCKSHRGRSPTNKTDALCIVEFSNNITRVFATVIPNKSSATLIPIICEQVAPNSIIWTDEHRSYSCLSSFNFTHDTVCHKYQFINSTNGVNTQAVESFNNVIKYEVKKRKGIKTTERAEFLKEVCWMFNNKDNVIDKLFEIIKVNN